MPKLSTSKLVSMSMSDVRRLYDKGQITFAQFSAYTWLWNNRNGYDCLKVSDLSREVRLELAKLIKPSSV